MEFKDLVSLYFERTNAMQTLWSFYITIALALLAFFGSYKSSKINKIFLAIIVSIAFSGFAYVNLDALKDVTAARNVTRDMIFRCIDSSKQPGIVPIKTIVTPATTSQVIAFHIAGDIIVLLSIWALSLLKPAIQERASHA